jgi:imidazolonepropionase-like amidohydrolase
MRLRFMRIVGGVTVALATLACGWLIAGLLRQLDSIPRFGHDHRLIAITNVAVIDVAAGSTLTNKTVLIKDNVISGMGDSGTLEVPSNAYRVDGSGKFLIPGLWDSHLHTLAHSPRFHFPLLIAHGVTSVRNMGDGCSWTTDIDCIPDQEEWSAQGAEASRLVPHIAVTASYHFEDSSDVVDSLRLLRLLKQRGDSLIKLQLDDDVDPALVHAIVEEAGRAGMPVAAHLPATIDVGDPVFVAMVSIEHGNELLDQCATQSDNRHSTDIVDGCISLLRKLADRRTAFVPTFVASTGQDVLLGTDQRAEQEKLTFAPQAIASVWTAYRTLHVAGMDPDDYEVARRRHRMAMELALLGHRSGVPVLVGSDALDPFVQHGASVHDELEMFVQAGFSNAEALRAATHLPAELHGLSGKRGQVIVGAHADLVLLGENPLQQIAATRKIEAVLKGGIYFDLDELERLQSFAQEQANSHALNSRLWLTMLGG